MTDLTLSTYLASDPLMPHLLDILSQPDSKGLILAGGFGLRIKQASLNEQIKNGQTLIRDVPLARSTQDLDLFLNMELWMQKERGKAVRGMLDVLDYEVIPGYKNLQFGKLRDPVTDKFAVKIDLHARKPAPGENVKFDDRRVGKGVGLHGRITPEAFAVDDSPASIQVVGNRTDGTEVEAIVLVPHPYASLNMKIKAAHDWLRADRGETVLKKQSERHAFDVYLLLAMILPQEINQCRTLAMKYTADPVANEIRDNARELFASSDGPAFTAVRRQMNGLPSDYETFWEGLKGALGLPD